MGKVTTPSGRRPLGAVGTLVFVLGILAVNLGHAATMTFTASAGFLAALGSTPTITETYEGEPANTLICSGCTLNGLTYTFDVVLLPPLVGRIDNLFNSIDDQSLAAERDGDLATPDFFFPGESFVVAFPQSVTAVGVFFNAGPSATATDFSLSTAVGTASTGGSAFDFGTFFFAGLIADTPFSSARIGASLIGPTTGYTIDNLTFAPTAVPGPAALLLLSSGLVGLGAIAWMRSRRR